MEISPQMVRDAIELIIRRNLDFTFETVEEWEEAIDKTTMVLTQHAYSFAELPEPYLQYNSLSL